MKLLLTSAGLSNASITSALFEMVGKKPQETSIVIIPTAANFEVGDKTWLIEHLMEIKNQNFQLVDIADISAVPKNIWLPKLQAADILFFEGGNTYHLMEWIIKSGLKDELPELMKTKVWIGDSAGSVVTNAHLALKISQAIYGEDLDRVEDIPGLGFVDFYFLPHLNSDYFDKVRKENIEKAIEGITEKIYAVDDNGAIKVVDGKIEVITEGEYLEFN